MDPLLKAIQLTNDRIVLLEKLINNLISWSGINGGACNDCVMFRRSPADIEFQHYYKCGHLVVINEALQALGQPVEIGHRFDDLQK